MPIDETRFCNTSMDVFRTQPILLALRSLPSLECFSYATEGRPVPSGILILAAGIGLFYRRGWAWFVGMLAGIYGVIANLFWLFAEPVSALVGVLLSALVIFGSGAGRVHDKLLQTRLDSNLAGTKFYLFVL